MGSLTTLFRNDATGAEEADKLVDLFRNRSELKKEFAALRNEKYQLQDRIKQHQGATARVQQQLLHLENLLHDPEWVFNVVVFYQLRQLTVQCKEQLSRFAEELKLQSEQRVHSKALVSWNEKRKQKAVQLESQIGEQRLASQLLEDRLLAERHKLMTMNGFMKLFRGRALAAEIDEITARLECDQQEENELLQTLDDLNKLDPPDHQGLDVGAKRAINFMILSFAQHLYLSYEEDNIVGLAKEASEKSVGAVNYGNKQECDDILARIEKRKAEVEQESDLPQVLKQRSELLAEKAQFRHSDDAVPVPASVATAYAIGADSSIDEYHVNLLGDNYFAIAKILSR